ncbi:MAG: Hpt domain-containing protein [Moraxellaceae bacterium]|nr:MAG: Hpt domain-containing protein [Moraxellaceae bacterium]
MTATQHLDYDALNSLKDVMEDDFGFLIETFIQDSNARLMKFSELISTNEADQIRRTAHSFKGSCSNLGALRLASLCSNLERKALNQEFDTLPADLTDIQEEFLVVKQMMLDFVR